MNAPTSSPADWRTRYGFDKGPSPESQAYWKLNSDNANLVSHGVNNMPFVLNPAHLMNKSPDQIRSHMFQGGGQAQGGGAMGGNGAMGAGMPVEQILGLVQQNPMVLPMLLERDQNLLQQLTQHFQSQQQMPQQMPGGA